jgi:hypothetical protein
MLKKNAQTGTAVMVLIMVVLVSATVSIMVDGVMSEPRYRTLQVARSTDEQGRTVLVFEAGRADKIEIYFKELRYQVAAHVELDSKGVKKRFTLKKPKEEGLATPVLLDLEGPGMKRGVGITVTVRW